MNTKDIIESGVLESYLLGLSTREEEEQVKQLIQSEAQIGTHLIDLENTVQTYFTASAVPPPPETRDIIELRVGNGEIRKPKHVFNRDKQDHQSQYLEIEVNDTHIKVHKYWRPAFIAVFILSKIFLIAGLYYYFKSANQQEEINRLKTEIRP